ncbi:MAG: hypothetical protein KGO81_14670 [Bacteroidota bacterium]|nr:hypothetical protein [Bacteroidota bacterium]
MLVRTSKWIRIPLVNLMIVSIAGVILRYKIAFSLPIIQQKYLLHGHSHFAFAGWLSQVLMYLLIRQLQHQPQAEIEKRYRWLLYLNLFSAYGMLVSFILQGYALFSIAFSTLSIFVSYFFAFYYWKDLNRQTVKKKGYLWFKAAVFFNAFSSIGAFSLAFMMAAKVMNQQWYLAAIYFFLHFQYNGWFFFACMGLLMLSLEPYIQSPGILKKVFVLFTASCIPAYFLSALWLPLPSYVYAIVVIAALSQIIGWAVLINLIKRDNPFQEQISNKSKWLFTLSAFALSIKLVLQLASVIPSLSQLAFGFRPIVIGYLHLVLLGVITIFIIAYLVNYHYLQFNRNTKNGILVFVVGVILNEVLLMIQGICDLGYWSIPYINESLLLAALVMFSGLSWLNIGYFSGKNELR